MCVSDPVFQFFIGMQCMGLSCVPTSEKLSLRIPWGFSECLNPDISETLIPIKRKDIVHYL